jgi:hypothetical protein
MTLLDAIPEGALVALDTMGWIYEFEANPTFGPIVLRPRHQRDRPPGRVGVFRVAMGWRPVKPAWTSCQ